MVPQNAIRWLTSSPAAEKIGGIIKSGRTLTAQDFVDEAAPRPMSFARELFLSVGAISRRDDDTEDLVRWWDATLERSDIADPAKRGITKAYAHWRVLPDFRRLVRGKGPREYSVRFAKNSLKSALVFLGWLGERGKALEQCEQNDVDVFFSRNATDARNAVKFMKWCERRGLMREMIFPRVASATPKIAGEEYRLSTISRLLADTSLPLQIRSAGLLVGLYGQQPGRMRNLRKIDVKKNDADGVVTISGSGRRSGLRLVAEVGEIVMQLAVAPSMHSGLASGVPNPWLFEGYRPGKPISESGLGRQFALAGIRLRELRGAALIEMGSNMELTMISDILDLCDDSAYRWWEMAGGTFSNYVGDRARAQSNGP